MCIYANQKDCLYNNFLNQMFVKINQTEDYEKFIRLLETNYKYSCFVTLSMRLIKKQGLNSQCRNLAKKCQVKEQKNYGIIALRLALLMHQKVIIEKQEIQPSIKEIYDYLRENFENCLVAKYKSLVDYGKIYFIELMKEKFENDLRIFRKVFETSIQNEDETTRLFTELYRIKEGGKATKKQQKEASRLAKIACGIYRYGLNYNGEVESTDPSENIEKQIQSEEVMPILTPTIILVQAYMPWPLYSSC